MFSFVVFATFYKPDSGWGNDFFESTMILQVDIANPSVEDFERAYPEIQEVHAIFAGDNLKQLG